MENNFLYNGKELQTDLDLDWYDYGARFYNPTLGRWSVIDPSASDYYSWSTYSYVRNNPIRRIDPDGKNDFDKVLGFGAAWIDNATGGLTNVRSAAATLVTDGGDFNTGQDYGDVSSMIAGVGFMDTGAGMTAGGTAVTVGSGGVLSEVAVPVAVVGVVVAAEGAVMTVTGMNSFVNQKGRVNADGKKYNGQSDTNSKTSREAYRKAKDQNGVPRSQQPDKVTTVREKGTGKPLKQSEYTNSQGEKVQIRKDNPKTYPDGGQQGNHYNAGKSGQKLDQHHNYGN